MAFLKGRLPVWNSRCGTHLGSGHVRPRQQTGHMIAIASIRTLRQILQAGGRPHMGRGPSGRYPAPSCPSPAAAPRAPVVMPADMMPGAARERFARPRAGTAPAPHLRSHPECALRWAGYFSTYWIYGACQGRLKLPGGGFVSDGKHALFYKAPLILRGRPTAGAAGARVTHKDSLAHGSTSSPGCRFACRGTICYVGARRRKVAWDCSTATPP